MQKSGPIACVIVDQKGCLFCSISQPGSLTILTNTLERDSLPIELSSVWPIFSPKAVHKDYVPCGDFVQELQFLRVSPSTLWKSQLESHKRRWEECMHLWGTSWKLSRTPKKNSQSGTDCFFNGSAWAISQHCWPTNSIIHTPSAWALRFYKTHPWRRNYWYSGGWITPINGMFFRSPLHTDPLHSERCIQNGMGHPSFQEGRTGGPWTSEKWNSM